MGAKSSALRSNPVNLKITIRCGRKIGAAFSNSAPHWPHELS
jgi:hypothetical protein